MAERKERSRLGLSKFTAEAAEQAAEANDKVKIARNVRDIASVHSMLWPQEKQQSLLAIGLLIGTEVPSDAEPELSE